MKYIVGKDGVITCEYVGKCGSCRVKEHSHTDCMPGDTLVSETGGFLCASCGKPPMTEREGEEVFCNGIHDACRGKQAATIAIRFGMIDGAHHKQWVIDQMLRAVLGKDGYEKWVEEMNSDPDYEPWDEGTPP